MDEAAAQLGVVGIVRNVECVAEVKLALEAGDEDREYYAACDVGDLNFSPQLQIQAHSAAANHP